MNAVNEAVRIGLRDVIGSVEPWGRDDGRKACRQLEDVILAEDPTVKTFVLNFTGIFKMDASFPQEAFVELIRKFHERKCFVLTNFENKTIEDNVSMAFVNSGENGIVRDAGGRRILGPELASSLLEILNFAETRDTITSKEVKDELKVSLPNASNKLKALWEAGLLHKTEGFAKSGGRENLYSAVRA